MFKKIDPAALVGHPRVRKWVTRITVFFAVVGLVGFLAVPPLAKWVIVSQLGQALQREVAIEAISLNPYTLTAAIHGFSVRETGGEGGAATEVIGFDSLRVNAELSSLFVAGAVVKEVELLGPRLRLTRNADGRYNFSDLIDAWLAKPKTPDEEGPPPRFSVSNIQIAGGSVEFDDRLEGVRHAVADLTLRLPFVSSLSFHAETFVEPHFSATVNDAPLQLAGRSRPFAESHESELDLDLDNLQLARYWTYSPVELPIRVDSGALDGKLRLRFLQTVGQPPQLTLDGSLALRDFRLVESGGAPLFAVRRIDLGLRQADLVRMAVGVDRIAIDSPEIDLRIDRQGVPNWLALVPPATEPAKKEGDPAESAASPLRLTVDAVELAGGALRLSDQSTGIEQRLTLGGIDLKASDYDSGGEKPLSVSLSAALDAGERLRIERIEVREVGVDLRQRSVRVGSHALRGLQAKLDRSKEGSIEFLRPPRLKATVDTAPPAPAGEPWRFVVDRVELTDHALRFEDRTHSPATVQSLALDSLTVTNLSSDPDAEVGLSAKLRINKRGAVEAEGRLLPMKPSGNLQLSLNQIELLPLQPYFGELLNLTVTRGLVTAKGELSFAPGTDAPKFAYKGSLTLGDFNSVDKINAATFLRWRSLHLGNIDVVSAPPSVAVGQIALSDFFARVIVSPEGRLNLLQLTKGSEQAAETPPPAAAGNGAAPATGAADGGPPPAAATTARAASEPLPVRIDRVTLQGGRVNFTDNFVKPNYSANLTQLAGRVSGLSSRAGTMADLELRGSYNDLAPLTIAAKLNPFAAKAYLDLDAEVKGVEMAGFSPYSGKYAGYAIEKGKLSLFLKYRIDDNRLVAENRVFLDQLTFGETVDSPDATKLPVRLAVALLKNRAGEIDINLPISGSLDDPEFSIGGIVVRVIVNLFVKAVTSPFALLGSLFGGGEEMAYVEFDYGYASLAGPMLERLQSLAKALEDRPGLKIELAGRIDPDNDREGLKHALMMRRVKAQRLEELVKQGSEAGSVDDVEIAEKDYPRYLEKAYKAEKFPKPRNVVGLVKTLPVEEMEKLMLANMNADDEALRNLAERRARNVAQWLTGAGKVAGERVFILQPRLNPADGPQQEKARNSRVDFSLK